jgi:hypothetical protein
MECIVMTVPGTLTLDQRALTLVTRAGKAPDTTAATRHALAVIIEFQKASRKQC